MTKPEPESLRLYWLISLFLMFAFIPLMQAQTISLSQCIDSVQSHSYILRAEKFNTDAAAKSVEIRHAGYLPSISGNVGAEGRFLGSDQYSFGQQWTMIHGDWSLGNLISKTEDIAKQELTTATLKQEKARIDGISRVTSLYMYILQKQKQQHRQDTQNGTGPFEHHP